MLGILLDLSLDASYKRGRFSKTLLEKSLKFLLSEGDSAVTLYLSLILLLAEVDLVSKKQGYKEDALVIHGSSHVKIVFILLKKVVVLNMQTFIV